MVTEMSSGGFLHPTLKKDTVLIASWPLCELLLMKDANYPWAILVPRVGSSDNENSCFVKGNLSAFGGRPAAVLERVCLHSRKGMMALFSGEKLNIGALGNMVSQLHVHHIVRYSSDVAWPAPVWGKFRPNLWKSPCSENGLQVKVSAHLPAAPSAGIQSAKLPNGRCRSNSDGFDPTGFLCACL